MVSEIQVAVEDDDNHSQQENIDVTVIYNGSTLSGFQSEPGMSGTGKSAKPEEFDLGQRIARPAEQDRKGGIVPRASVVGVDGAGANYEVAPMLPSMVRRYGITALDFDVAKPVRIRIDIYSISGVLVRQAVDKTLDPGRYTYKWDIRNVHGERVAPGVYIAVMKAPGFAEMTKLIVVR